MSTGKRLAKRSIIGTRVSARGKDGKYYNGYIHALKSPASATAKDSLNISSDTLYSVRFDAAAGMKPPSQNTEFTGRDLIAPGFESIDSATFVAGQKVYLTYNGREIQAEVTEHRKHLDEVDVMLAPNGQEGTVVLTKRIDDLRLSESRKSPRLADQDTDFARLADMGSDRKRSASHSIDVPHVPGSRKRRPSSNYDSERPYGNSGGTNGVVGSGGGGGSWQETTRVPRSCGRLDCPTNGTGDCMDECTAALVLMSLSCSPHSPYNTGLPFDYQQNYGSWGDNSVAARSPGITSGSSSSNSSSSSSGASWRTGTPSPPLSEGSAHSTVRTWHQPTYTPPHNHRASPYTASRSPSGSTPGSSGTWDEGIERDYDDEQMRPRKKTKKCRTKVKRERVGIRRPCTGYIGENREQTASPKEIRIENVPALQRPALVPQRATPVAQRSTPVAQRAIPVAQRPAPATQRQAQAIQRLTIANGSIENREGYSTLGYKLENNKPSVCTWPNCTVVKATDAEIEDHVRRQHLEPQKKMELAQGIKITKTIVYGEEEFYYQEVEAKNMSPPPTMSHRDMARPPHEDPEYQRQLRLQAAPTAMIVDNNCTSSYNNNNVENAPRSASVIRENKSSTFVTFGVSSSQQQHSTTLKHMKLSAGQAQVCQQNSGLLTVAIGKIPAPRRGRGDTKKCRKIYGMEKRELWCTQCKWKKACTRYGN